MKEKIQATKHLWKQEKILINRSYYYDEQKEINDDETLPTIL